MTEPALSKAISEAADELHNKWREEYRATNGDKPRWKPLKEASAAWVDARSDISATALRTNPDNGQREIDIAGLPNSKLPPQHSGENTTAAKGAIEAIIADPRAGMESFASTVHDQWVARNSSWAPDNLKVPYAALPEAEKEKDRVIVRVAAAAVTKYTLAPVGQFDSVKPASSPTITNG